jgi:hypothetical protein
MTVVKRSIVAALAVFSLVLVVAAGTFLVVDDATLVALLMKRLEAVSQTRISYQDDAAVTRTLKPELSVKQLVIDDVDERYRLETDLLRVKLSLPSLLIGRLDIPHLLLGNTRVDVKEDTEGAKTEPPQDKSAALDFSALRLRPILHDVQVSELSVFLEGEKLRLPSGNISELSVVLQPDRDIPELSAEVDVEGEKLYITATLPDVHQAFKKQLLPFSVTVKGVIADLSAVGQVDFSQADRLMQAEIRAHAPDLQKLPTGIEGLSIPGELTVTAQLDGPFGQLAVSDLAASWEGPGESSLNLTGAIVDIVALEGTDLKLAGRLEQADWLAPVLPESLGALSSAELAARISSQQPLLNVQDFSLKAKTAEQLDLSLDGRFDVANLLSAPDAQNMDLRLVFSAPTTRAARVLLFDDVPEFGAITASADIRSTTGDPLLENIDIQTRDKAGIRVALTGGIARFPLSAESNRGYALDVTMTATRAAVMAERAGLDLPLEGPLDLRYRIEGDTQALQLNRIKLAAGESGGTFLKADGRIAFRDWEQQDPIDSIDILVELQGRDTGFVSASIDQELPPIGYRAGARFNTVGGKHRIDDYRLTTLEGEPLDIVETGYAESISFLPEFAMQGINVKHESRTNDVASLNRLFKLDGVIPSIGSLDLHATISGTDKKLLISDVDARIGQEDILLLKAKGRLGYISAGKKWRLEDTDLDINARSTSSQAMAKAFGWRIPELGPVTGQASLNDKDKTLGIDRILMLVGAADQPVLRTTGSFGELYTARKVNIETALDMQGTLVAAFSESQALPELGSLRGKMIVSDSSGALGMDSLQLKSVKEDILSLDINGRFTDFSKPETLELNCWLTAQDINLFAALLDLQWPGHGLVELDMQVRRADKGLVLEANWISGKEKVDMLVNGDFTTTPPTITGKITGQNVFLPDPAERKREEIARKREQEKKSKDKKLKQKEPVFSRDPVDLDWMDKANVELDVDIESFDREHSEAQAAKMKITLKSRQLLVRPAALVYPQGQAVVDLRFDASGEFPRFSFTMSGENLDPWRGLNLQDAKTRANIETSNAELDVDIRLEASGRSPHEMASNLAGDIYITMKHGKISRAKLDLLFIDLVGWVAERAKRRYADINCAIADYSIASGLVSTNAFFIDTNNITIAGEGTIDLGKEKIDYTFIPKKKSRLIARAEPVTLKGPLNDPAIKAIPVKSAALTFGTLIFAPYVFAGMVASEYATEKLGADDADTSVCTQYEESQKEKRKKKMRKNSGQ